MTRSLISLVCFAMLAACGGDDAAALDLANRDPRCISACPDSMPPVAGAGDVCMVASRVQCLDECEVRIAGVMTTCANCLVEDACFGPNGCLTTTEGNSCDISTCTVTGWNGTCTYPVGNEAAHAQCEVQVSPRREVACTAKFRPTTECVSVCNPP
jgi:hypothetical protein